MGNIAIIAEFNPLHKGHRYIISEAKRRLPDDKLIIVMSPNFVQRGEAAVFDKFTRGRCAIDCGADLVVSAPQVFSLLSAEGFARAFVEIAHNLGADRLAFGAESDSLDDLLHISKILLTEEFESVLHTEIDENPEMSFPALRQKALGKFLPEKLCEIIRQPNNILAIEYIKASLSLGYDMQFIPIKRKGDGHLSQSLENEFVSSSAIRCEMRAQGDFLQYLPIETADTVKKSDMLDFKKFDEFVFNALTLLSNSEISHFCPNRELSNVLCRAICEAKNLDELKELILRKKFPYTKISRLIINIILNIENDEFMHKSPKYVMLLGANKSGRQVLAENTSSLFVASCPSVLSSSKDREILAQFKYERLADLIWSRCLEVPQNYHYFINKKPYILEE